MQQFLVEIWKYVTAKEYNILSNKQGQSASLEDLKRRQSLLGFLLFGRAKISKPRTNDDTSNRN